MILPRRSSEPFNRSSSEFCLSSSMLALFSCLTSSESKILHTSTSPATYDGIYAEWFQTGSKVSDKALVLKHDPGLPMTSHVQYGSDLSWPDMKSVSRRSRALTSVTFKSG